ncbi:MAG TPA: hypothetical protein VKU90_06575 [Caulobacteraceae bacterium]|jgi:hypothetical protein|nr:hypothetical protein [Caulobacteraceae bacterium]
MAVRQLARLTEDDSASAPKNEVVSLTRGAESPTERIRRLQWEASVLAAEQTEAFANELQALAMRALEIAEGGEAYPAGVRELAQRIAGELPMRAKTLLTIQHRNGVGSQ